MQLHNFLKSISGWINRSTQRRLIFASITFWVVALSVISVTFLLIGQNQMLTETRQRNVQIASMVSRDIHNELGSITDNTRTFVQHLEMLGSNLDGLATASLGLRIASPEYRAVYYFDTQGTLLFRITDPVQNLLNYSNASQIIDRNPAPVAEEVLLAFSSVAGNSFFASDVYYTPVDFKPVFYLGMPVNFSSGKSNVIIFQIDLSSIWQRIDLATIGKTGFTYVVSRSGTIITHPDTSYIGTPIPPEIRPVLSSFEGFTEYVEPVKKREVLAAYSPVGGYTDWGIVVEQEKSEIYATIIETGTLITFIWILLGLIGTASIFLLIRSFTKPIKKLTYTARNIARTGFLTKTGMGEQPGELGQLSEAFDQMIGRIEEAQKAKEEATLLERTRLARELHDAVSQTLFSATIIADVIPRIWEKNQDEGKKRLEEIRQLTRGALAEMRTLLFELRPSALADVTIQELFKQLAQSLTGRARIPVELKINGECDIPTDVKISLYRICQEALNNIVKHSLASQASIDLDCSQNRVVLEISDNGKGFDVSNTRPGSLGLGIMRERVTSIDGKLSIDSDPDHGTTIKVVWEPPRMPRGQL